MLSLLDRSVISREAINRGHYLFIELTIGSGARFSVNRRYAWRETAVRYHEYMKGTGACKR